MKLSKLIHWIVFISIFAMATRIAMSVDSWWHLRVGQWMVENRMFIQEDVFSFTRLGTPWQYTGAWVEIWMYLVYDLAGFGGLNIWAAGLITLTFWIVWKSMDSHGFLAVVILLGGVISSSLFWTLRPHLISFVLTAVFLAVFDGYTQGKRKNLWAAPALMLFWVNSHPAYLIGMLIFLCYFADALVDWGVTRRKELPTGEAASRFKHLSLIGILLIAAVFINFQGTDIISLPFATVTRDAEQSYIQEWQSPNFHQFIFQPFGILLLLTFGAMAASDRPTTTAEFLLIAGFGATALWAGRFVATFAVIAPVVLLRHAQSALEKWNTTLNLNIRLQLDEEPNALMKWGNRAILVTLLLGAAYDAWLVIPDEDNWEAFKLRVPVEAVEKIKEVGPAGNIFNSYSYGGYLMWALPEYPVYIDSRADPYGEDFINLYFDIVRANPGWQEELESWDVNLILLETGLPILKVLPYEGWELLYEDDLFVVYQKE